MDIPVMSTPAYKPVVFPKRIDPTATAGAEYFNLLDGGLDMVADEFSMTVINSVDGGYNAVRGLGSYSRVSLIDGNLKDDLL